MPEIAPPQRHGSPASGLERRLTFKTRGTAAGLSVFAAAFFVLPIVAAYLPASIKGFAPYLPSNAGGAIWGAGKLFGGHQLGPWTGFAVLCGYAVVLTGLAAWRLRRRDA